MNAAAATFVASPWAQRAADLTAWALRLVNRTDVWGGYLPISRRGKRTLGDGTEQNWLGPVTKPAKAKRGKVLLTEKVIGRHFTASAPEHVIGLHTTSPDNTSKWGATEIDWHGEDSADPQCIASAGTAWYRALQGRGFHPLLTDSNGKGGLHLRVLLKEPIPTPRMFWFLQDLVKNYGAHGLTSKPETFPKQSAIEPGGYGNWLRLPGRHHTREHWSRVWDGAKWLDGNEAIDFLLALPFDPPALIPEDIEWQYRIGEYMAKLPTGMVEASGRDDVAFQFLAFLVRDLQLPDDYALSWAGQWDSGNRPPKGPERLREILKNVHDYGKHAYGQGLHGTGRATFSTNGKAHEPEPVQQADPAPSRVFHLTDRGNAERVIDRHGQDIRYVPLMNKFLAWSGRHWRYDDLKTVEQRVKETQRSLYQWAAAKLKALGDPGEDEEKAKRVANIVETVKHCLAWEAQRKIAACIDSIKSEPGVPILPEQLDANLMQFNCLNGTLDLRTGELRPHRREDLISKLARVECDPAATCPLWMDCLATWMDGNSALIGYLQRSAGYALTGLTDEQVLWFFHGSGQNGKSVYLGTLVDLLGDYALTSVDDLLLQKKHQGHPTEKAALFGKRFVMTAEQDQGRKLAEALMKTLTGGDKITARRMREDFWEFKPSHKIFLAANHKPEIKGQDFAVWRRIKLIPWLVRIPEEKKDPALQRKLRAEWPGILRWLVDGCREWQCGGLREPSEVTQATAAYKAEQNTIGQFLAERCTVLKSLRVRADVLRKAFEAWQSEEITRNAFASLMEANGCRSEPDNDKCKVYKGIGLNSDSVSGDYGDSS